MKADIGHNSNALEDIATRARLALEQVDAGEKMTMEGWLQYGAALNEGREMFPKGDNKRFAEWLATSNLERDLHPAEVSAAMWAAANPEEFEKTKAAYPRSTTVRGLHKKWKEEQVKEKRKSPVEAAKEAWDRSEKKRKKMEDAPNVFDLNSHIKSTENCSVDVSAVNLVVAMEQLISKFDRRDVTMYLHAAIQDDVVNIKIPALHEMADILTELCEEIPLNNATNRNVN
jgi:hypothetical protein